MRKTDKWSQREARGLLLGCAYAVQASEGMEEIEERLANFLESRPILSSNSPKLIGFPRELV